MIEDYFKYPSCTELRNTYQIEPTSLSAVLVTEQTESDDVTKESVWIAGFKGGSYSLVSYGFVKQSCLLQNAFEFQRRDLHPKLAHPKLCETVSTLLVTLLPSKAPLYIIIAIIML